MNHNVKDGVAGNKTFSGNAKIDTKNGILGAGSDGYDFSDGFRVELRAIIITVHFRNQVAVAQPLSAVESRNMA